MDTHLRNCRVPFYTNPLLNQKPHTLGAGRLSTRSGQTKSAYLSRITCFWGSNTMTPRLPGRTSSHTFGQPHNFPQNPEPRTMIHDQPQTPQTLHVTSRLSDHSAQPPPPFFLLIEFLRHKPAQLFSAFCLTKLEKVAFVISSASAKASKVYHSSLYARTQTTPAHSHRFKPTIWPLFTRFEHPTTPQILHKIAHHGRRLGPKSHEHEEA